MGKIDKEKEYIGALKTYLGFILAVITCYGDRSCQTLLE